MVRNEGSTTSLGQVRTVLTPYTKCINPIQARANGSKLACHLRVDYLSRWRKREIRETWRPVDLHVLPSHAYLGDTELNPIRQGVGGDGRTKNPKYFHTSATIFPTKLGMDSMSWAAGKSGDGLASIK